MDLLSNVTDTFCKAVTSAREFDADPGVLREDGLAGLDVYLTAHPPRETTSLPSESCTYTSNPLLAVP